MAYVGLLGRGLVWRAVLLLIILGVVVFSIASSPAQETAASEPVGPAKLQAADLIAAVNAKRAALGKPTLEVTDRLTNSAKETCANMSSSRTYGDTENITQHYEYTRQYFDGHWVVEAGLAVNDGFTAEQTLARWIESPITTDTVLDNRYHKGGAATCDYTADYQFDTIVILHLAS